MDLKEQFDKLYDEISKKKSPIEENSKETKEAIINSFSKNKVIDSDSIEQHNLEYREEKISNFIQLIDRLGIDRNIGKKTISINIPISAGRDSIFVIDDLNKVLEEGFIQEAIKLGAEKDAIVSFLFNELIISYKLFIKSGVKKVLELLKDKKSIEEIRKILNINVTVDEKINKYDYNLYNIEDQTSGNTLDNINTINKSSEKLKELIKKTKWSDKNLDQIELSDQILKLIKDGAEFKEPKEEDIKSLSVNTSELTKRSLLYYISSYSCTILLKKLIEGGIDFSKYAAKVIEGINDIEWMNQEREVYDRAKTARILVETVNNKEELNNILYLCSEGGFSEAARIAIKKGADIHSKVSEDRTSIRAAVCLYNPIFPHKDINIIKILMENGADPYEKLEGVDTFDKLDEIEGIYKKGHDNFRKETNYKYASVYEYPLNYFDNARKELHKRDKK